MSARASIGHGSAVAPARPGVQSVACPGADVTMSGRRGAACRRAAAQFGASDSPPMTIAPSNRSGVVASAARAAVRVLKLAGS